VSRIMTKRHVAISMMMMANWEWLMKQVLSNSSSRSEVEYDRSTVESMPIYIEIEKSDEEIPTAP
jgi:hypothetical protein